MNYVCAAVINAHKGGEGEGEDPIRRIKKKLVNENATKLTYGHLHRNLENSTSQQIFPIPASSCIRQKTKVGGII
jgi:hypothetical protein